MFHRHVVLSNMRLKICTQVLENKLGCPVQRLESLIMTYLVCPGDDPVAEHARWFPNCDYISKLKGTSYVNDIRKRQEREVSLVHISVLYRLNFAVIKNHWESLPSDAKLKKNTSLMFT